MFFNEDGTIKKVIPTLRGVGLTNASKEIQIDRYSLISNGGASVAFLDTLKKFDGWKTILDTANAWVQYNSVDFGSNKLKTVNVRASSITGGTLQLHLNKTDGPLIADIEITKDSNWNIVKSALKEIPSGIYNLVLLIKDNNPPRSIEIDWVSFE